MHHAKQFVLFRVRFYSPYARSMMLRQGAAFDIPSISVPRETSIGERQKGEGRGKTARGSRFRSASFCFLDFVELVPIASLPTLQHPPFTRLFSRSYSRAVLLPSFFFVPEGNTEHLLREIKKKRLSGADARLRSSRCTRRRNDNSSRRILAFLIY